MGRVSIIFLLLSLSWSLLGVPAYPYPIEVKQPDGSTLLLKIRGDEYRRYRTNIMGDPVVKGKDGFYRPSFTSVPPYSGSEVSDLSTNAIRSGSVSALIIPVEFSDVKFTIEDPHSHYEAMINGSGYSLYGSTGSAKEYFTENLDGWRRFSFDVADKVSLPNQMEYYGWNKESRDCTIVQYDAGADEMIRTACEILDPEVNFSRYNYVFIFFAGYSEAEGGDPSSLWPASLNLSSNPIELDGAVIFNAGYGAELRGSFGSSPSGIGPFCHEFGHVLGLPDLYDVDYDENGMGKGMWGTLALMDYGCYNNQGRTPPYMNAVEREILGMPAHKIIVGQELHLEPVNINSKFYKVDTMNEDEYYLIEARQEKRWDAYIGGEGMLVYHIDKSSSAAGMITASVRWEQNLINSYSGHECADLVEALPSAVNVKQVFFPGMAKVTGFGTLTDPHFVDWNMRGVGIKLTDIRVRTVDKGVSFRAELDKDEILLRAENVKCTTEQRSARISWKRQMRMDATWGVRWKREGEKFLPSDYKIVDDTLCSVDGLKGGEQYEAQIYHIGQRSNGDTVCVKFKTLPVTSPFPYIHGLGGKVSSGDTIRLKVFNLSEEVEGIEWYLDGQQVPDGLFHFGREGVRQVEAKIRYIQDGSVETISKEIAVERND